MKKLTTIIMLLLLAGCAAPAEMSSMVISASPSERINMPEGARGAFVVTEVGGGESTNPLWTSEIDNASFRGALERSLELSDLMANGTPPKHEIEASLVRVDQPLIGIDMTVTTVVHYTVRNIATKDVWFDEPITASYTAVFSDAFLGITRLKLANEGAVRKNLSIFIEELMKRIPKK